MNLDAVLQKIEKGVATPEEQEQARRVLASQPSPDGVYAPITLANPADIAPVAYVLHNFTTLCLGCGAEHKHSEIYALNHIRMPHGTTVRHMVPISRPEWNVPLREHNLTTKTTPICFECTIEAREWLTSLPKPPVANAMLKTLTEPRKAAEPKTTTATKSSKSRGKTATIDDLLA